MVSSQDSSISALIFQDANLLGSHLCQWHDFDLSGLWEPFMDVSSCGSIPVSLLACFECLKSQDKTNER